jgi:chromosome segregation ATPase
MPRKRTKKIIAGETGDTISEVITILEETNPQLAEILRNAYSEKIILHQELESKLSTSLEQIQNLQNLAKQDLDQLRTQNEQILETLKSENGLLLDKIKSQAIQLNDVSGILSLKDREINQLQSLLAKKNAIVTEAKNEVDNITKQFNNAKKDLAMIKLEYDKLNEIVKITKDESEKKIRELSDELQRQVFQYEIILKKTKSKCLVL